MGLDIYNISDKKRENLLFSINNDVENLVKEIQIVTGVRIDIYGTSRFGKSLIKRLIESDIKNSYLEFYNFLRQCQSKQIALVFEGD